MAIVLGSENKAKIKAVQLCFPKRKILTENVNSGVANQPLSDIETRNGAINRAISAQNLHKQAIGIGLEGGVMLIDSQPFLCNWGAMVTVEGNLYTAAGARIPLPKQYLSKLKNGDELSCLMDEYVNKKGIRNHEGASGIFTNGEILRNDMFNHVVKLLKGQVSYEENLNYLRRQ